MGVTWKKAFMCKQGVFYAPYYRQAALEGSNPVSMAYVLLGNSEYCHLIDRLPTVMWRLYSGTRFQG